MRKHADPDFIETTNKHDVIILTETWISQKTCYNLDIRDYSSIHLYGNKSPHTRKGRFSGGISVYFKSYINGQISSAEKTSNRYTLVKTM